MGESERRRSPQPRRVPQPQHEEGDKKDVAVEVEVADVRDGVEVLAVHDDVAVLPQRETEEDEDIPGEEGILAPEGLPVEDAANALLAGVPCPRCASRALYAERDHHGPYIACRICGFYRDLIRGPGRAVAALAETG